MIDEKKLIEFVEEIYRFNREKTYIESKGLGILTNEVHEAVAMCSKSILDKINNSPKVGKWIPVSEKLPEQLEKVLVFTNHDSYYIARLNTKKEWVCIAEMVATEINYAEVIAWMPLPEPYKESED